jgi:hypothetical protein
MPGNTRFTFCHLCGRRINGHLPLCMACYKTYAPDGNVPPWLRFLVNDLKRENRSDTRFYAGVDNLIDEVIGENDDE